MNVLVTGATGFVGREIARQLHGADHQIRLLVRRPESRQAQQLRACYGAELQAGDVTKAGSLEAGWKGIEAVIHVVGIISEAGKSTFERVHVRGTQNVVVAAQRAGVRRLVHMSALGTRPEAVSRYHQTKWAAEEAIRHSGLDFTIFRPSLIYGPYDHFVNLFARLIRFSPVLPLLGDPKARFQPVPVETVGEAFVKSLSEPKSIGRTFDLCGPESLTLSEMLDRLLAVMGRKRLKVQVPLWAARAQAAAFEMVFPRLLRLPPPLNRDQLLMLCEDNVGDPKAANGLFGLRQLPFEKGIARYVGGGGKASGMME